MTNKSLFNNRIWGCGGRANDPLRRALSAGQSYILYLARRPWAVVISCREMSPVAVVNDHWRVGA